MNRIVKNLVLIELYKEHQFDALFNNPRLFLAWTFTESGHDQFCLRYEPDYKYINKLRYLDLVEKISYGLFQIMGANLFELGLANELQIDIFLHDLDMQYRFVRKFLKKCPSTDINENLRWWNTGSVNQSESGDKYISKIYSNIKLFSDVK